jgi:translation initiation factor 2 subunit 3
MSTMLTGASIMDCALLLVAANIPCPQPQTKEHLVALIIMKLTQVIIVQNKVDIIFKDEQVPYHHHPKAARRNFKEIKEFIKGTLAENSPIIPISAQLRYNTECIL